MGQEAAEFRSGSVRREPTPCNEVKSSLRMRAIGRNQYFDLIAYVTPVVNWKEFRLVGGSDGGGSFR